MGEIIRYKCPNCSRKFAFSEGIGMNYPLACADILERIINRRNMSICDDGARIKELALAAKRPAIAYYDGYFTCDDCDNVEGGRMIELYDRDPDKLVREWNFRKSIMPFVACTYENDILLFKSERKCQKCGKIMSFEKTVEENRPLKCHICSVELIKEENILFD